MFHVAQANRLQHGGCIVDLLFSRPIAVRWPLQHVGKHRVARLRLHECGQYLLDHFIDAVCDSSVCETIALGDFDACERAAVLAHVQHQGPFRGMIGVRRANRRSAMRDHQAVGIKNRHGFAENLIEDFRDILRGAGRGEPGAHRRGECVGAHLHQQLILDD